MNTRRNAPLLTLTLALVTLVTSSAATAHEDLATLTAQVRSTEIAFAKTMADRDLAAFGRFLAPDAVFVDQPVARGPAAIIAAWKELYAAPQAPFSWAPEEVEVLDSGKLALTSGPVFDPKGERIGRFTSVWRRERDGHWRIVLDHGCPACRCPK
jgi:ketosteroid isomerase-like protein